MERIEAGLNMTHNGTWIVFQGRGADTLVKGERVRVSAYAPVGSHNVEKPVIKAWDPELVSVERPVGPPGAKMSMKKYSTR